MNYGRKRQILKFEPDKKTENWTDSLASVDG